MDLERFKTKVQGYCRSAGYKQARLAADAGMDPSVLSNKLNGNRKNAPLSHQEIKSIVRALGSWGAISYRDQAIELFELMDLPPSSLDSPEWVMPNLAERPDKEAPAQTGETVPLPLPPCPYRGLAAFREEDAPLFFGREKIAAQLFEKVNYNPVVAVLGSSGSGKSSLVQAGLIPALRRANWQVVSFRPGQNPFRSLVAGLVPLIHQGHYADKRVSFDPEELAQALFDEKITLSRVLPGIFENASIKGLVLVIDQFEELYTLYQEEAERRYFLEQLLSMIETMQEKPLKLVFTLRADFLGQVLAYRPLADQIQVSDLKLGPLSREELREAIVQPARLAGVEFEEGLAVRIVEEVFREPGGLPLLEFLLTRLWDRQVDRCLHHRAYEETGGLRLALSRYADEVLAHFDAPAQKQVRQVFTQLIRPGEGTVDTRRIATRHEIGEANWPVAQTLVEARLLSASGSRDAAGSEMVEIAHEALIEGWDKLRDWVREDRAFRVWQEQLRSRRQQWLDSGRDEGLLLLGSALTQAENWQIERSGELSRFDREFIRAGIEFREKEFLARKRRIKRTIMVLSASLVVLLALTGLALFQWSEANTQRVTARGLQQEAVSNLSRVLATQSRNLYTGNRLDLGLLVSLEALKLEDSPVTRSSLLEGLLTNPPLAFYMFGHTSSVESVAFSPDGKLVASASADKTVRLWDAATGKPLGKPLVGHTDLVLGVAFSPDGKLLASGSVDKTIRLWDVATGVSAGPPLEGHTGMVYSVAFSPDGKLLASGSEDKTARIWNLATRQSRTDLLDESAGAVRSVAFSPDGKILATGGTDKALRLWDASNGLRLAAPLTGHTGLIYSLQFSPDGKLLASCSADKTVRLWKMAEAGYSPEVLEGHTGAVRAVAFSPDGSSLVSAGEDKTILWWALGKGNPSPVPLSGHNGTITSLAFSPDSTGLISGGGDSALVYWNLKNRFFGRALQGFDTPANAVAFSPDGKSTLAASNTGTVLTWDSAGNLQNRWVVTGQKPVGSFAFSPDKKFLAQGNDTGEIIIRDLVNNRILTGPVIGHKGPVNSLAFSPDGKWLASTGDDTTVRLREAATGIPVKTPWLGHTDLVFALAFSPDGKIVASGSQDKTIRLWDAATGNPLKNPLAGNTAGVRSLAFSPNGKWLVSGSDTGLVMIWDVSTGQAVGQPIPGHVGEVRAIAFAPDGRTFATAGDDTTAALWDFASRKLLARFSGAHTAPVTALAFSSDGKLLATAGDDGRVITWVNSLESWQALACQRTHHNLTTAEWQQFFGAAPYRLTCPEWPPGS